MAQNFGFMLDPAPRQDELRQGDVLRRTPALSAALSAAHEYYATANDYDYFLVLTPTCQLVVRNGSFSTRYITLAAIRPLETYLAREIKKFEKNIKTVDGSVLRKDKEILARQLIERVLHNTQDGYLFLPGEFFPDKNDRMAFLLLSVALRIKEHYSACLESKFLQLKESFSAKVGNLTSHLYGQVATEAIEEQIGINPHDIFEEYFQKYVYSDNNFWLSEERISRLKVKARAYKAQTGQPIPTGEVSAIISEIPSDGEILASRVLEIAQKVEVARKNASRKKIKHFENELLSDPVIKRVAGL